jgi:hypothetical protein
VARLVEGKAWGQRGEGREQWGSESSSADGSVSFSEYASVLVAI